jgi:hypothetical protein
MLLRLLAFSLVAAPDAATCFVLVLLSVLRGSSGFAGKKMKEEWKVKHRIAIYFVQTVTRTPLITHHHCH